MMGRPEVFLISVVILVVAMTLLALPALRRRRRASRQNWEALIERLTAVESQGIERVALDIVDVSGVRRVDGQSALLEASEIWSLVGGIKGLDALAANCEVLIDLAAYVQQWYPEALLVAEELRQNAREIQWQIARLRAAETRQKLDTAIAMYAQNIAATYYLMTRKVLSLYEQGSSAMLADLERSL